MHYASTVRCMHASYCSIAFTYQFHFVGTESWRQNVSPLPPHIITSGKDKLMCLSINTGSEKTLMILKLKIQQ